MCYFPTLIIPPLLVFFLRNLCPSPPNLFLTPPLATAVVQDDLVAATLVIVAANPVSPTVLFF